VYHGEAPSASSVSGNSKLFFWTRMGSKRTQSCLYWAVGTNYIALWKEKKKYKQDMHLYIRDPKRAQNKQSSPPGSSPPQRHESLTAAAVMSSPGTNHLGRHPCGIFGRSWSAPESACGQEVEEGRLPSIKSRGKMGIAFACRPLLLNSWR
jgi:hypothetical protein